MKTSPAMLDVLRKVAAREGERADRCVNDDPHRTVVALLARGLIETYQDGTTTRQTQHSVGAFGRDGYTRTHWNIPVIRARITDAGRAVLAAEGK